MKRSSAALLALAIASLLIANSAAFFFRQPYYEWWDLAANSFSIIQAKHFALLYGAYSRWGFLHPGPALFYVEALGEWLFYDVLRWVPAPYNGQLLMHVAVMAGFFAAALQVWTRWLPARSRPTFLALAISAGACHFGWTTGLGSYDLLCRAPSFLSNWSGHAPVLPFLCLLTAGASVAAGGGEELPLLMLSGGLLVHIHVVQPLFVFPVGLLAYFALWRQSAARERRLEPSRPAGRLGAAWRASPRAHCLAAGLLLLFALPPVLDLFRGRESNAAAILNHLHAHHGEHKKLARSFFYFLQFGAYASYEPDILLFARYDLPGMLAYLWAHAFLLAGWAAVGGLAAWTTGAELRKALRPGNPAAGPADHAAGGRFLGWCGGFLFLSVALTLYWGTIQDGEMYFYNAYFNFAIYYFALLIALAVLSGVLQARYPRWCATSWGRLSPLGLVLAVCLWSAGRWQVADPAREVDALVRENTFRAVRATAATSRSPVCADLVFEDAVWHYAIGVALQLARAGDCYTVPDAYRTRFGLPPAAREAPAGRAEPGKRTWRFEGTNTFAPRATSIPSFVLRDSVFLNVGVPPSEVPGHPAFFNGEQALPDNFYHLTFPNGNDFGYYTFTRFPYFYHQDLGFECFIEANDGQGGAYLYDFASKTFFYTSPTFPFPYLYDFNLQAVLYYFPDPKNPGRYSTNPRWFYNTATRQFITK